MRCRQAPCNCAFPLSPIACNVARPSDTCHLLEMQYDLWPLMTKKKRLSRAARSLRTNMFPISLRPQGCLHDRRASCSPNPSSVKWRSRSRVFRRSPNKGLASGCRCNGLDSWSGHRTCGAASKGKVPRHAALICV